MKRTVFDESRDMRIADEVTDRSAMCRAQHCPNRWSVDLGRGRLCGFHAWSEPHLWPRITQEQLDAQIARALYAQAARAACQPLSRSDKRAILAGLSAVKNHAPGKPSKAWAQALRQREMQGERLSRMQQQMWRCAVVEHQDEEDQRHAA